jgi:hypothetical protein
VPHVGESASGEQFHLAIELKVPGIHDGQATGLQYANREGSERLVERDAGTVTTSDEILGELGMGRLYLAGLGNDVASA